MKKFKKAVLCLAVTSVVSAISIVGGASAATTTPAVSTTAQGEVTITNLGLNANDTIFSSNASKDKKHIIWPLASNGRNISYDFSMVSNFAWSDSPLPTSTYGTVPLKLVQWTPSSSSVAKFSYQFSTKDGTKKSSVQQVVGDIQTSNLTLTFTDVPKGTSSNPVYLIIVQKGTDNYNYGNGYTSY